MSRRGQSATSLNSVKDAKKDLEKFLRTVQYEPSKILREEARRIEAEAKAETPRDTGKLEQSVKCLVSASQTKFGLNLSATARDRGFDYSALQHENYWYYHRKGKYHYLIDPFNRGVRRIKKRLEDMLRRRHK